MKIFIAFLILFQSLAYAQQTPEDILNVYRNNYFETIHKRHELFLLEYNKARLQDYITLYRLNSQKINSVLHQFQDLSGKWNSLVRSSVDQSSDLPVLASIYVQSQNLKGQLEESVVVMGSIATSIQKACSADAFGWMKERFLPTSIYSIPHYQFSGDSATNDLHVTFQMNYTTSFGSQGQRGDSSTSGGSAQLGDGSKEATAFAAAGMVSGVVLGSVVPFIGPVVGGYVGMAVGTLVGTVVSTSQQLKEMNATYHKMRETYAKINIELQSSHERLDSIHENLLSSTCINVFNQNFKIAFSETFAKSQSILSLINSQTMSMNKQWAEVKLHNQERFQNNQMFLQLLSQGYDESFESSLDELNSEMTFMNDRMKSFYREKVASALSRTTVDLSEEDELISLQIQGEAQFDQPDFANYIWPVINERINSKLGIQ